VRFLVIKFRTLRSASPDEDRLVPTSKHWSNITVDIGHLSVLTAPHEHRRSQRGLFHPKRLAFLVILCFERRCPKKYCCSLSQKTWSSPKFGWLRYTAHE